MDAKKITEDYHDWHNIAELRLLGLSRSQIAKKLQLPPGREMCISDRVKALLLPLHCICELFRLFPRQQVLPALSLVATACRNRRRDTNFPGYGGPFRKIDRSFVRRTNNNRITVKRTWLKLKSKIQK